MRVQQADIVSGTVLEFSEEKTIARENVPSAIDSKALTERVISNADVLRTMPNVIGRRALPEKHEDILRYSRKRNPFNHPAVCFRKDVILRAGGYNDDFPLFEDYDLWTRALANGAKGYNLPNLFSICGRQKISTKGAVAGVMLRICSASTKVS